MWFDIKSLWLSIVLAAGLLFLPKPTVADDPSDGAHVVTLLEACWTADSAGFSRGDGQFAAIERAGDSSRRTIYARVLLLMHQRRYDDASTLLQQPGSLADDYLPLHQANVWIAALLRDFPRALTAARHLGEAIARASKHAIEVEDPAEEAASNEAARFLGSMCGFFAGPLGDNAAVAGHEALEKEMLGKFSPEQRQRFLKAKQLVLDKLAEFKLNRETSREAAIADAEADKQKTLEEVEKRRDSMADDEKLLQDRKTHVQQELSDELDAIVKLDRPLQSEVLRYQGRAAGIRANLDLAVLDITRLQSALAIEKDPIRRNILRTDLAQLGVVANRTEVDLAAVSQQAAVVQSQRAELAIRQSRAQRDYGGQLQSIDRQLSSMRLEVRKLANAEKKAHKPSSGSTGKVNGLATTAAALKSYENYPIERERTRLLEAVR